MMSEKIVTLFSEYPSISDIMKMLGVGRSAVYTLLQNGTLRSVKVGRKYIIPKQSVIDFITLK